jgi:hypothetical protein
MTEDDLKQIERHLEKARVEVDMIMVHLWHPCKEIDVWHVETNEEKAIAIHQGYIALEDIRNAMSVPTPRDGTEHADDCPARPPIR